MFEKYQSIFNRRGEAYHQAMRLVPGARRKEFLLAIDHVGLQHGDCLCDAPSGGGYLVEHLAPDLEVRLIAVDPSEVFSKTWKDKRIEWHLAPLQKLPIEDAAANALVSIAGLHHVDDWPVVFGEMRRVVHPGGRWCILEVPVGSITDRFLNGFVNRYNSMGHEGRFVDDNFRKDLMAAGFQIETDDLCRYTWDFSSEAEMTEFARLMFWLDKASPKTILDGIKDLLGVVGAKNGSSMNWELQLIVARPS